MKKITPLLFIAASVAAMGAYAQTGINTTTPTATLEVQAKNSSGTATSIDGLLIPRVDRQRAQSMTAIPTSTLIYVNSIATGTATGNAANIDAVGYYFYNGTLWLKLGADGDTSIYNTNGALNGNRTVTQAGNTLAFTGTAVNAFSVDGTTLSVNAANHRVGIGTIAPQSNLQITSSATGGPTVSTANAANVALQLENSNNGQAVTQKFMAKNAAGVTKQVLLGTNPNFNNNGAAGAFFITRDGAVSDIAMELVTGNIGLGVDPTTTQKLSVGGNTAITGNTTVSGKVGIGTTTPSTLLDLGETLGRKLTLYNNTGGTDFYGIGIGGGLLEFYVSAGTSSSANMVLNTNGNLFIKGSLTQNSDIRLKKDIIDNTYGLKEILNLRTINYRFKDEQSGKDKKIGFIAQEIKAAMPELVHTADDEMKTLSVSYPEMTVVLTKAVQELQEMIKKQQAEIDALKQELKAKK